ncbi:MAG: hypothetical protein AB7Q42_11335 [Acidimicrobiia bacterium]
MSQPSESATDPARRSQLLAVKLASLVREHTGGDSVELGTFPGGAALVRDGHDAWVLLEERPERGLGPALAWARQQGAAHLHVIAEQATGILARRAAEFAEPPTVWEVSGRSLSIADPEAPPPVAVIDPELLDFAAVIERSGATPVVDHGVLVGEVFGLEVCRAVRDETTGAARLDVGVGAHDREAFQLMHGDAPIESSLARVVAAVAEHRRPGADPHALNRLGAERALRARLIADPALVGLTDIAVADPPVPRMNLKDPVPCVAVGLREDGGRAVVVCSVGIDLDLVPFAADARLALLGGDPDAELLIAVPERDAHAVTKALAAALCRPAVIVPVPPR